MHKRFEYIDLGAKPLDEALNEHLGPHQTVVRLNSMPGGWRVLVDNGPEPAPAPEVKRW